MLWQANLPAVRENRVMLIQPETVTAFHSIGLRAPVET